MTKYKNALTLGFIVNPIAGIGGPAGLKGSDDVTLVRAACEQGAENRTYGRALRFLSRLDKELTSRLTILTFAGELGEFVVHDAGLPLKVIGSSDSSRTTADDTKRAVELFILEGVDLILFVGGDGTARDVCSVVGEDLPALGVPSGVKMHSGVFAISPEAAAEVVQHMARGELVDLRQHEVRDIDESALRSGVVKSRYFGDMQVPECGQFVQQVKEGGVEIEALVLDDIAAELLERIEPDTLYLVGAGTTPHIFMEQLGLDGTLLGVDVVLNEALVAVDVSASQLEKRLADHDGPVVAIMSITGGQGALIGRGNQQFSVPVLKRIGKENIWVVATKTKMKSLNGRPLLMDSNDVMLDQQWSGFISVITGYHDTILYPLGYFLSSEARERT